MPDTQTRYALGDGTDLVITYDTSYYTPPYYDGSVPVPVYTREGWIKGCTRSLNRLYEMGLVTEFRWRGQAFSDEGYEGRLLEQVTDGFRRDELIRQAQDVINQMVAGEMRACTAVGNGFRRVIWGP